ncbi:MAG: TIGR04255 family protein [Magnetococcales bacterium]|nr:TIGR04255 family protein [Magnetococcales bacterium]
MVEEIPGRVIFTNNPLVEVVGQVRFPMQLEIDQIAPVEFQKRITSAYPNLQVQELKTISLFFDAEKGESARESEAKSKIYLFSDPQNIWRTHLSSNAMTLTCVRYGNWEEFRERFTFITSALLDIYPSIQHIERIGLRYHDIILKSKLKTKAKWGSLVPPFLLGPTVPKGLSGIREISAGSIKEFQSVIRLTLDENGFSDGLHLQYGLVRSKKTDEEAFRMDFDFYNEQARGFDHDDIFRVFNRLHGYAYRVFIHCITPKLYGLLGPRAP